MEAGAVCGVLMVQGHLGAITLAHVGIASQTGLLAVLPVLALTFTRYATHFANRWVASGVLAAGTFVGDAVIHGSHYPGAYTEAALTAAGAFVFSLVVSYTPIGKAIDRRAAAFLHHPATELTPIS